MNWFRREPLPVPKVAIWMTVAKIGVPIIFAIIFALLGLVYTGLAESLRSKVDKDTLKQMILNQKQMIETNQKALEKQQTNIEHQQQVLDKTLQLLIKVQTEQKMISKQPDSKPTLTTQQLMEYLKMTPEQRTVFRTLNPAFSGLPK
jgi:hypothetical protein